MMEAGMRCIAHPAVNRIHHFFGRNALRPYSENISSQGEQVGTEQ